ncbi:ADP-ribosylglycohydrolase family protein [Streptomyces sp. NPDC047515]|uniref:ADP-ribosylglycohydrolase family protein n=1 Tax=Streptomyces sp. NPDC047515 TaxID=3155380 RepID=UPI0033EC7331
MSRGTRRSHGPLLGARLTTPQNCHLAEDPVATAASFENALAVAVDVGGDTDTVAAVTGGLAGAVCGFAAIPQCWTGPLHVPLPGHGDRVLRTADLATLARRLDAGPPVADSTDIRTP